MPLPVCSVFPDTSWAIGSFSVPPDPVEMSCRPRPLVTQHHHLGPSFPSRYLSTYWSVVISLMRLFPYLILDMNTREGRDHAIVFTDWQRAGRVVCRWLLCE